MAARPGLSEILVEERLIAREQLNQAVRAADRLGVPLVLVLIDQGILSEDALVEALGRRLSMERFDPLTTVVDPDAVREVPFEEASRYRLLPIQLEHRGGRKILRVAMANPLDHQAIEDLEFSIGGLVEPLIGRPSQLSEAIRHHYRSFVTRVIPRSRSDNSSPFLDISSGRPHRRAFGGDLDETKLRTRPVARSQLVLPASQRLDALIALLVRKGVIAQEEYEAQLQAIVRHIEGEG
jgi:hypothetical protein